MRFFTKPLTFAIPIIFAVPGLALAQDTEKVIEPVPAETTATVDANFTSADIDQNGTLNRDEFVSFAVMRSDAGDNDMKAVVLGGEYDVAFTAKDADASGEVSLDELGAEHSEKADDHSKEKMD